MAFALIKGIPIVAAERTKRFYNTIPASTHKILNKSRFFTLPAKQISPEKITRLKKRLAYSGRLTDYEKNTLRTTVRKLFDDLKNA